MKQPIRQRLEAPALTSWTCLQPRSPPCGDPSLGRPDGSAGSRSASSTVARGLTASGGPADDQARPVASPSSRVSVSSHGLARSPANHRAAPALPVGRHPEAEPSPIDQPVVQHHLGNRSGLRPSCGIRPSRLKFAFFRAEARSSATSYESADSPAARRVEWSSGAFSGPECSEAAHRTEA